MKDIIIIGAGGAGRETMQLIKDVNKVQEEWNILGYVDDNEELNNKVINGIKVLGNIEFLNNYDKKIYTVCAIGYARSKKKIIDKLKNNNIEFANLIHPSAILSDSITMGKGIIIQAGCVITTNVIIGNHVQINPQCGIGHDSKIGEFSSLFWNVNLAGFVDIGIGCVLGTKTTVIQNLSVGEWSIIGSNSNIISNIQACTTAVGNPARSIKQLEKEE